MRGRLSAAVIGTYLVMMLLIAFVAGPRSTSSYRWALYFLLGLTAVLLLRYLTTHYTISDSHLIASRVLGGRRVALEEIRGIEYASLRDLAPTTGAFGIGAFGWRGRMHSSTIGEFDAIYTDAAAGLLVTAGAFPLYVSPAHRESFARELSRRARSYSGALLKDVGDPTGRPSAID
ncbi:MAG TPA: PH domain-containing protein [Thermoplasmata archaeon]|nr:PH domain-containing protein [Thermoplasmata archaeon]